MCMCVCHIYVYIKKFKCMNVHSHIKLLCQIYSSARSIMQEHKLP